MVEYFLVQGLARSKAALREFLAEGLVAISQKLLSIHANPACQLQRASGQNLESAIAMGIV
jgi:hypothetical protein